MQQQLSRHGLTAFIKSQDLLFFFTGTVAPLTACFGPVSVPSFSRAWNLSTGQDVAEDRGSGPVWGVSLLAGVQMRGHEERGSF